MNRKLVLDHNLYFLNSTIFVRDKSASKYCTHTHTLTIHTFSLVHSLSHATGETVGACVKL